MKLSVLFFASLREDVGCESVALELSSGSFAELRSVLIERLGAQRCEAFKDHIKIVKALVIRKLVYGFQYCALWR